MIFEDCDFRGLWGCGICGFWSLDCIGVESCRSVFWRLDFWWLVYSLGLWGCHNPSNSGAVRFLDLEFCGDCASGVFVVFRVIWAFRSYGLRF